MEMHRARKVGTRSRDVECRVGMCTQAPERLATRSMGEQHDKRQRKGWGGGLQNVIGGAEVDSGLSHRASVLLDQWGHG
nr:hypothetical protein CFP56_12897 [Quercus suber]